MVEVTKEYYGNEEQRARRSSAVFQNELAKKTTAARRSAYEEEAIKQERIKARARAVAQYNQPKKVGIAKQIGSFIYKQAEKYTRPTKARRIKGRKQRREMPMREPALPWATGSIGGNSMGGTKEVTTKDIFGW